MILIAVAVVLSCLELLNRTIQLANHLGHIVNLLLHTLLLNFELSAFLS